MSMGSRWLWIVLLSLELLGCSDCATQGCDALTKSTRGEGTGIGGVLAEKSDVVGNGCQECPFGEAQLAVWAVEGPVTPEEVSSVLATPSERRIDASKRFQILLPAGDYLFCVSERCVNLTVTDGALTTANVKMGKGSIKFLVVDAAGRLSERMPL
jgi:hypothetical protein